MKTGLLGRTLGHSFSPDIHKALGNIDYQLFEVEPENLAAFLADSTIKALNVTIPYKETVIPYCQSLTEKAKAIGAVNTLVRNEAGQWIGDNTDFDGVEIMLDNAQIDVSNKKCLILGGGGTAKTVRAVLAHRGAAEILNIVRRNGIPYRDLPLHVDAEIIINTTPVGMYPNCPDGLISLESFNQLVGVADVIYNPLRSKLLLDAKKAKLPHNGGLAMLVAQAVVADGRFFGREPKWAAFNEILAELYLKHSNIILIGMPGVGKTTIGKLLAEKMKRPFIDLDMVFTERWEPPSQFIPKYGEAAFRQKEQALVKEYGAAHGMVIACGGGVVTRPENEYPLRQNGRLYWLQRPLEQLSTKGRPLSTGGQERLHQLYRERSPLYQMFTDVIIENNDPEKTAIAIREELCAYWS